MVIVPEKVVKIQLKHFSAVLIENYKNCNPNSVTTALVVSGAAKVVKIRLIQF